MIGFCLTNMVAFKSTALIKIPKICHIYFLLKPNSLEQFVKKVYIYIDANQRCLILFSIIYTNYKVMMKNTKKKNLYLVKLAAAHQIHLNERQEQLLLRCERRQRRRRQNFLFSPFTIMTPFAIFCTDIFLMYGISLGLEKKCINVGWGKTHSHIHPENFVLC